MQQQTAGHAILQHFMNAGDLFTSETEVLGATIRHLAAHQGQVTNKAIIIHLIKQLECMDDVVQQDILRQTLELVLSHTPDDLHI